MATDPPVIEKTLEGIIPAVIDSEYVVWGDTPGRHLQITVDRLSSHMIAP